MAQCGDVTAGPYSAAPYDITFEYTEESQVVVYYIENRIEIFVPQNDPNYPWTFQHATRITFTSSIPPQPVYIRRNTDITPLKAEFQTGNAIRAQDLNKNFQQLADACNENQADYKCLQTELENFRQNVETSLQYTNVANVTTLNAVAVTNPDDQTGYDVLDSTGIDSAASPVVTGLPATAGGDPGEDPVNGVYWNSGIVTRVTWNRTSQSWTFISYYSRDGDNRYQQQTAVNAVTPNPADYKDGSLWFDSGDANLYILYNDGNSRQWVITNPLSAYGQIVTTSDVHWNRNAQTNTVYPKNSTDTIANYNSSGSIDSSGAAVFTSVTSSGAISGDSLAATNAITGASVTATGNISSATLNTTGNVGIGTTSPSVPLEVSSSSFDSFKVVRNGAGAGAKIGLVNGDGNEFQIIHDGGEALVFRYGNSTERMRITDDGKVGIGDTSPTGKLTIADTTANTIWMTGRSADDTSSISFRNNADTAYIARIAADNSGALQFRGASSEAMRIDSSGNVGIGTSSPSAPFVVNHTGTSGTDQDVARFETQSGGDLKIAASDLASANPSWKIFTPGNETITLGVAGGDAISIDSSNRVGIGTSSPGRQLNVHSAGATSTYLQVTNGNSGGGASNGLLCGISADSNPHALFWLYENSYMQFATNGSERMRIDSSGRLLVGSSTNYYSNAYLQISGTNSTNYIAQTNESASDADGGRWSQIHWIGTQSGGERSSLAAIQAAHDGSSDDQKGRIQFLTNDGNDGNSPTERMRIDSSGRLLVGTSSESGNAKLIVRGGTSTNIGVLDIQANIDSFSVGGGNAVGYLRFKTKDSGSSNYHLGYIGCLLNGASSGASDIPGALFFGTSPDGASSPVERMRITSNGNLLIGRTNDSDNANVGGIRFAKDGTSYMYADGKTCLSIARQTNNGTAVEFRRGSGTPIVGTISVTTSGTSYNTSSDHRLKENVVGIADGITRVKQLQPRRFNFIADADTTVDGFIAHEAQTVVPEAVTGTHNEVDDDGNAVMQGIDQSKLVPLLTAALQEAIAKIETLEQRLTDAGL